VRHPHSVISTEGGALTAAAERPLYLHLHLPAPVPVPLFVLRRHPRAKRRIPVFAFAFAVALAFAFAFAFALALALAFLAVIPQRSEGICFLPFLPLLFNLSFPKEHGTTYFTPNVQVVTLEYTAPTFNSVLGNPA
jgi:hypothetical protein